MPEPRYLRSEATFDPARVYRYTLLRVWDESLPRVAFVMLNPSTATETELDPTLRRCLGYAQRWGCGSFEVGNIFALRSTDPRALYSHPEPVGMWNDAELIGIAKRASYGVVAGWGTHGALRGRGAEALALLRRVGEVRCLRLTVGGHPTHPLYQRGDLTPVLWQARTA